MVFLANGSKGSSAAERAKRFAGAVESVPSYVLTRQGGKLRSVGDMVRQARTLRPDLVYCVDLAAVPLAASILSDCRAQLVVDTGDHPSEFLRHVRAGAGKVASARLMEEFVYRRADAVVVRGEHYAAVMRGHGVRRVEVIPDGVDLDMVKRVPDGRLRERLGLTGATTIGIAGYFTWYERLGGGLGWELVQVLALLRDLPVRGVLIGAGTGLDRLRVLASELGIANRLHILGSVPYADYARYLSLIDICLLTQTNDPSSWVRTTGKLPGYLAASRYILASAVGTAQQVLPDCMLVPYSGSWDLTYPGKLAERIREIVKDPAILQHDTMRLRAIAERFSYTLIAAQARRLIDDLLLGGSS